MKYWAMAIFLPLAACAPSLVSGNSAGGIVKVWTSTSGGMKLADEHCRKFNKVARPSGHSFASRNFSFDCVAPS